jgi:hypothetical protein
MREKKSLDDILGSFNPKAPEGEYSLKDRRPITIWVPASAKTAYDHLQEVSGRRFSKKAREILLAVIAAAEAKV